MNNQNEYSCYSVNISNKFSNKSEIKKEMKNIFQIMKRIKISDSKYDNISFIIGMANVDSRTTKTKYIYTGKKGRPKKIILGTFIEWHLHIYVINLNGSASTFSEMVKNRLKNKKGYIASKNKNDSIDNAIRYLEKQSISVWKYGEYF